jgi:phenylacetate-CoA ligase
MNEIITRHFLLPVHERLRGRKTMRWYRELCRSQRASAETISLNQLEKLRRLLLHCLKDVPYYQQHFRSLGMGSYDRLDLAAYNTLPPLTKDEIRSHLHDLVAESYRRKLIKYSTGGSTGEPLVFYTDLHKEAQHNAQKLRSRSWFGVLPGDRQVDFWGSPIELEKLSKFRIWKDRRLLNQVLLSAFNLTEERLNAYTAFVKKFRPRLIYGYATVIYRLAQFIIDKPDAWGDYRPKLISCTSEMLYEHQREVIAKAFLCPVANEYGSRDGGLIAHECPKGGLHIAAEHVLVEIDNPDESGVGDILITNLDGYGMPLLRYRIGDRGRLHDGECDCGLPLPLLGQLAGRSNDFLVGRNGKLIHSLAPVYVLREIPKLRQFKLVQRTNQQLEIQMVSDTALSAEELESVRKKMKRIFEFDIHVNFIYKDVIAPEKSGKYRWVVSEVEEAAL